MNKSIAITAAVLLGGMTVAAIASPYGYGPDSNRVDARVARMTEHLNLSNEQQKQIRTMIEAHKAERQAMRGKMHADISSVLNDEQKAKFQAMHEQRHQARLDRKDKRNGIYCNQERGGHHYRRFDN